MKSSSDPVGSYCGAAILYRNSTIMQHHASAEEPDLSGLRGLGLQHIGVSEPSTGVAPPHNHMDRKGKWRPLFNPPRVAVSQCHTRNVGELPRSGNSLGGIHPPAYGD